MGHTRLTTQGNQKYNFNNHPFYGKADKKFAFAHNGVLYNDDTIRKEKKLPKTHIETDSYVAVQLIEKQGKLNFESLKNMAEDIQGNFTFTILDQYNTFCFVKGSSPMFLIYFEQLGLFAYASTESIMSKAMKKSGLNDYRYSRILLSEGDILSIDRNGKTELSEFEAFAFKYNFRYSDRYDSHEELLLEMCGCIETARIIHKLFGGQQIAFPKKLYCAKYVNECIRNEFDGRNIRELARQFGISERRIRQILHESK